MRFESFLDSKDKYRCWVACKMVGEKTICIFDIQDEKKRLSKTKLEMLTSKKKCNEISYLNNLTKNTQVHISYDFK